MSCKKRAKQNNDYYLLVSDYWAIHTTSGVTDGGGAGLRTTHPWKAKRKNRVPF